MEYDRNIVSKKEGEKQRNKWGQGIILWVKLVINYFINLEKLCIKSLIKKLGIALRIDGFFFRVARISAWFARYIYNFGAVLAAIGNSLTLLVVIASCNFVLILYNCVARVRLSIAFSVTWSPFHFRFASNYSCFFDIRICSFRIPSRSWSFFNKGLKENTGNANEKDKEEG